MKNLKINALQIDLARQKETLPVIYNFFENAKKSGFDGVLMTGSGSCVYLLTAQDTKLEALENKFKALGYKTFITKTIK